MKALVERIGAEGSYLGKGILKVDSFLNHRLEPALTLEMGRCFFDAFTSQGDQAATKIVTIETSGIAPALAAAIAFDVPVVYARKHRPITMPDGFFHAQAPSHTKGGITDIMISPEFLHTDDQVLIIDDFLATGKTLKALVDCVQQSGAVVTGLGSVIEKSFEGGRERLESLNIPIVSLAIIDRLDDEGIEVRSGV